MIRGIDARVLPALLALFLVLFTACGRHRAQVNPPVLKPGPPPTTTADSTPKKPVRTTPPPAAQQQTPEVTVPETSPAVPEPPALNSGFPPGPLIRIGLMTDAKEIRISSPGEYYLTEKKAESSPQTVLGEIQVRVEQEVNEDSTVYRVQVASFSKLEPALELKETLSAEWNQPVSINENAPSGRNQVRVGEFPSKEEAQTWQKTLAKSGYPDCFVVREAVVSAGGGTTLAIRGPKELFRVSKAGFLLQPSSATAFLSVNGKPYRGFFDITLNKNGRITVVNQVGMEEYLLGVVPAEISPTSYPESAALAAQAITARTYALFHLGKYRSEGFDLTDDTRTQVYEGIGLEKNATSDAVRQTSGLGIYYQDKLIDAMFMSTCGGRTEDFANVYDSAPVPYLKSVFCAVESGPEKGETVVQGRHAFDQAVFSDDGSMANRNLELAQALGLVKAGPTLSNDYFFNPVEKAEVLHWIETAGKLAQKTAAASDRIPDLRTRAGFLQYAAEVFFGAAEIKTRVSPRDIDYYLGNLKDGDAVPESARSALSYLIQNGLWRPQSDNTVRPGDSIRRGDAVSILLRWVESSRPDILRKGTFVSAGTSKDESGTVASIQIKWANKLQEFRFADDPYLFRVDTGRTTPVSSLRIIGNEKLSFHVNGQGAIDFLEIELNPTGASSDRYSPVASWDTTLSRSAVAEKLRGIAGNIGEFRDLKASKTGESGRAVRILVTGSRSSIDLNGDRVRGALGLRSTLFSIKREYNPDGTISSFTFHGRGWGHGIGLCQVGAFGMARAGRSYEEIIKTYFQGVQIRKAY